MVINPKIFKAYDIRGIYPSEINEKSAYLIGRAFVGFLNKKNPKIAVGRDNRLSSPSLFKSLTEGIIDQGGEVINIGLSISPLLYFTVGHLKLDGGINITASHNPSKYNGFKLVGGNVFPISEKTGIKEIKALASKGTFERKKIKKGKMIKKDVLKDYIRFNLKGNNLKSIKSLNIVIDTANAVPGVIVPKFFKETKCNIYHLFSKLDGSFPNHEPSPHEGKNLKELEKEVLNKKADLGIAFDGDGDRIIFVDEKGKMIRGDFITVLMIGLILRENPGEKILYDIRSSNIVRDTIKEKGGKAVAGRMGHTFIKEKMRKKNIFFQGELNGHYYLKDHYFSEAPFFVIFKILEEISKTGKTISQLVEPYNKKYFYSGEINFQIRNKKKVLETLEKKYANKGGKVLKIDGLRVDFKDWWFLVRASNTEPLIRLVVEANTESLMREKIKEIKSLI